MTERQMWDRQAEAWECAERDARGMYRTPAGDAGICSHITWEAGYNVRDSARARMEIRDPGTRHKLTGYWWPRNAEGALERAAFCRKMALECADEEAARD